MNGTYYFKEWDEDLAVVEVVEVEDDQSVVSLKSNDSDLKKKTKIEKRDKGGWTNAIILLGTYVHFLRFFSYHFSLELPLLKSKS